MAPPKKQNTPKPRVRKKTKKKSTVNFMRLFTIAGLLFFLVLSVCTVGYVIFFRTVFAQEILPRIKEGIVFEEPDPPVQEVELVIDNLIVKDELPKVAIIIDDMGYHKELGKQLLQIPFPLTYSFLPFAPNTKELELAAYEAGKTVYLHLPLEPKGKAWDPGPGALFLSDSSEIKKEKFEKCLMAVPHAVGVNNHMGSLYTEEVDAMGLLLKEVQSRSLSFVDSYTTSESVGLRLAQERGIKSARRHVFLDNDLDEEKICKQLEKLVVIAEKKGWAIGIAHPHRATVDAINNCGEKNSNRIQYVSVLDVLY